MSELNPLNDLSRVYLDHVANANQQNDDKDIKRWEEGNDALDKQMETSSKQLATLGAPQMEEEVSYVEAYVTELKKTTLGSYVKKASKDLSDRRFDQGDSEKRKYDPDAADDKEEKKLVQREKGISRAATKLSNVKEDAQSDAVAQMSGAGGDPQSDAIKQVVRGEKKSKKRGAHAEMDRIRKTMASQKEEVEPVDEAMTAYEKARKAAARRAADRNAARRRGEMGGRMERETYTDERGVDMHHKGYRATPMKKESFSNWRQDLIEISSDIPLTDVEAEKVVKEKKVNNKVTINPKMSEAVAQIGGEVISETQVELDEKQKDTPDQVKAVIAFDKARKGTDDATYDSEHGKKKQAKKERDYAKWQRDKGAEDAQKSGHRWKHAKGSTREKEGKKSETHAYIKDSYAAEGVLGTKAKGILGKEVKELEKATYTMKDTPVVKADKTDTPNYKGNKFGVKEASDWIQGAVKRPGAFTRKAKAADMGVQQFAKHVDDNPGKYSTRTKKQANLAQTFASMKKEDVQELFYTLIVD